MTAFVVGIVVVSLIGVGCTRARRASTAAAPTVPPTAKIVVLAPLSGTLATQGVGIRNSVDLAVRQASQREAVRGWQLQVVARDDAATPEVGAEAASAESSDPSVVGVVGPLNSSVAQEVLPVLDWSRIATISPGNTNDALTRGPNFATKPVRPHTNYFRVATLDSLQGAFAADYAFQVLGARAVVVIHDKKTYGKGIAEEFGSRFVQDGGIVSSNQEVNAGDKDFSSVLGVLAPLRRDLMFYGGEFPEAALLSKEAKQMGMTVPLMGGDGIRDAAFVSIAGQASEGDLATSVGGPAETLASAQSFISAYRASGYKDGYGSYGVAAYDAANAIVAAMARVLPGRAAIDTAARQAIINAVAGTDIAGATGRVAFDQYGDNVTRRLSMYRVISGVFVAQADTNFGS